MKNARKIGFGIVAMFFVLSLMFIHAPKSVFADSHEPDTAAENPDFNTTAENPDGDVNKFGVTIRNPLRSDIDTFPELVEEILRLVILIAVPLLVLAIIYTGFLFVKAQGDEKGLTAAKDTLLGVVIGAALILGAWVIAEAIQGTVEDLGATTPTVDGGTTGGGAVFGTD